MTVLDASEAVIDQLKKYIEDNVEAINKVYAEWPSHSQELDMPCCSVRTIGSPEYRNDQPFLISNETGISKYQVGTYEMTINIDIWAENKQQRGDITNLIFDLFNKQFIDSGQASGLSLALEDYHNTIARYDLSGYNYNDSEEASQRNEYRTIVSVLASFIRIVEKAESTIEEITITTGISDNDIDNPDIEEDFYNKLGEKMGIFRTNNPLEYDEVDGIVIDEKAPSPNVQGVGTGVVCLVGQFQRGPQKLDSISSITDLQERYGKSNYLGNIQLKNKKFASGMKVVRVIASDAAKSQILADDGVTTDLLQFDAKDKGVYGNSLSVEILAGSVSGKKIIIRDKTANSVLSDETYDNYLIASGVTPFANSKIVDVTLLASSAEPALAAETNLASGTDGTIADTDYEDALALAEGERSCNIVILDEYNSTRNQYLKIHAALTQDRMVICGVPESADVSAVITEAGTLRDTDGRIILAHNWISTLVDGAPLMTSPTSWYASILSQTAPQVDPASANNLTFMFGALELKTDLNRANYIALMEAGVSAFEYDQDLGGFKPKSGVVTQIANSSKLTVLRRRMADYLTNSIGLFLKLYQNDVNSASKRNEVKGSILAFIQGQENLGILPKDSEVNTGKAKIVDVDSLNTDASVAAGQFKIQYKQRIYSSMRFIVLVAEIGESVVVTEGE